jgi:hypothetical protein
VVRVSGGEEVRLSIRLHNVAYGAVSDVVVRAKMVPYGNGCWRITARAHSQPSVGGDAAFGPVLVVWRSGRASALNYVPGSARLLDEQGRELAKLADNVMATGAAIPYAIRGGDTDFVDFVVRVR